MNTIKIFKKFPSFGGVRGGLIILFIVYCSLLNAQSWPPQGMQGNGSQGNPWQIADSSHLRALADYVNAANANSDATMNKYYILMNDIDLIGYANWTPIGFGRDPINNYFLYFGGNFNGNGKIIRNLTINRPMDDRVGLFGYVCGVDYGHGSIENLGVVNCNITGKGSVGSLAGCHQGLAITNCFAIGNVNGWGYGSISTISCVGGLVGTINHISVSNCYFTGNVSANNIYSVGGLIGYASYSNIFNCYATGSVKGEVSIGGLVGYMMGDDPENPYYGFMTVSNCYANNNVQGNAIVGGLVGTMGCAYAIINNCVATNDSVIAISNKLPTNSHPSAFIANRIVGSKYACGVGAVLQNNYALNIMVVQDGNGNVPIIDNLNTEYGMSIPMDSLKSFTFYNTGSNWYNNYAWNIYNPSGIWKICDKQDLPFLRWQGIDCYYDITAVVGAKGNINPLGMISVKEDTSQTFIFTPNPCYEIDSLWIDGVYTPDSIAVCSYTFNNVTKNHTIEVSFKKIKYLTSIADMTCSNVPYTFGNQSVTSSGIYYDTLQNINGCDSVIELDLTVNFAYFFSDTAEICQGETYTFLEKLLDTSGVYFDTLQTIHGCDSIFELILTVNPLPEIPTITKTDNLLTSSISYSYQWYCNGVSIFAATLQNYTYTENGKYSVAVTNEFGCTSISKEMDVFDVGIVETDNYPSLRVYPNPTNGQLRIECRDGACPVPTEIEIYSVVGQLLQSKIINLQSEILIDISHLANGIYFLKINNKVVRFVKE